MGGGTWWQRLGAISKKKRKQNGAHKSYDLWKWKSRKWPFARSIYNMLFHQGYTHRLTKVIPELGSNLLHWLLFWPSLTMLLQNSKNKAKHLHHVFVITLLLCLWPILHKIIIKLWYDRSCCEPSFLKSCEKYFLGHNEWNLVHVRKPLDHVINFSSSN